MNITDTGFTNENTAETSQAHVVRFKDYVSRRYGGLRHIALGNTELGKDIMPEAIKNSGDITQENLNDTPHDIQMRADRKAYRLGDNIINVFIDTNTDRAS